MKRCCSEAWMGGEGLGLQQEELEGKVSADRLPGDLPGPSATFLRLVGRSPLAGGPRNPGVLCM